MNADIDDPKIQMRRGEVLIGGPSITDGYLVDAASPDPELVKKNEEDFIEVVYKPHTPPHHHTPPKSCGMDGTHAQTCRRIGVAFFTTTRHGPHPARRGSSRSRACATSARATSASSRTRARSRSSTERRISSRCKRGSLGRSFESIGHLVTRHAVPLVARHSAHTNTHAHAHTHAHTHTHFFKRRACCRNVCHTYRSNVGGPRRRGVRDAAATRLERTRSPAVESDRVGGRTPPRRHDGGELAGGNGRRRWQR